MKQLIALVIVGTMLSGCGSLGSTLGLTTPSNYILPNGSVIETTEEMAIIAAKRDGNIARENAFAAAMGSANNEGARIALTAAYFGRSVPEYQRSKTWDERLLPWVSGVFMPLYIARQAGNKSGENGVDITGDGNTVVISKDSLTGSSQKNTWITPLTTINKTTQTQLNTGGAGGTNNGTQPAQDPVIVEPSYPPVEATPTL